MSTTRWRKASKSGTGANDCVELAHTRDQIRDSKNPDGPVLRVPVGALLEVVKRSG